MSNLSTLPKGDSAWLLRKALERIMEQVSVLETNIGSSTTGNSANTQIIFNDNGTLRGDAGLVYNKTTDALTVAGLVTAGSATISGDLTVRTTGLTVNSSGVGVGVTAALGAGNIQIGAGKYLGYSATAYITPEDNIQGARIKANNILVDATSESKFNIGGTLAMTLNATGLGIGVSPSYKLDVLGPSAISGRFKTAGAINALYLEDAGTTAGSLYIGTSGNTFRIITGNNVSMNVDVNGNVGIGVTPSTWAASFKALQVGIGGCVYSRTADQTQVGFGSNVYFDTTDNRFEYIGTGQSALYRQDLGVHQWFNAPSGPAGDPIPFTQAMTLDASGNLLVGTVTSPAGAKIGAIAKLSTVSIEGTASIAVSTTAVTLSRVSSLGGLFFVQGYADGTGTQAWFLVAATNLTTAVIASGNTTGLVPTFTIVGAQLKMVLASGTFYATSFNITA